jgi:methylated-DNA-[protein]-cysteine S-methyltransferase
MFCQVIKVGNDEIGLVWDDDGEKTQVERIYLPGRGKMVDRIVRDFPAIDEKQRRIPEGIDQLIADLYDGIKKKFDLSLLNVSGLTSFSAKVLKQAFQIPRGKVAAYSSLAAKIGCPRAARAVGSALANNPFPIVIPCHRVVRSDGRPGQFGGGSDMKRRLLQREGIILDKQGRVPFKYRAWGSIL